MASKQRTDQPQYKHEAPASELYWFPLEFVSASIFTFCAFADDLIGRDYEWSLPGTLSFAKSILVRFTRWRFVLVLLPAKTQIRFVFRAYADGLVFLPIPELPENQRVRCMRLEFESVTISPLVSVTDEKNARTRH